MNFLDLFRDQLGDSVTLDAIIQRILNGLNQQEIGLIKKRFEHDPLVIELIDRALEDK